MNKYVDSNKLKSEKMLNILNTTYPLSKCSLDYTTPIHLVVALILAAQCRDKTVNDITPILFAKYIDVYALSQAELSDIIHIIKSCTYYIAKAKNIKETANMIVKEFGGIVPDTMINLCRLHGIGRKSSNIILQECFGKVEGIAVDTHVTRISRKTGFSNGKTPLIIEKELMQKFNMKYWRSINNTLVYHGRAICSAQRTQCDICPLDKICPKNE